MERFLDGRARIDKGRYYYVYRLTPEFLDSRKRMVLYYAGVKTFFQVIVDLFLLKLSFYLCFRFPLESQLFFWGLVALGVGIVDAIKTTVRFLFICCDELQGKRVRGEHYGLSPRYLGEDQEYVYYFKDSVCTDQVYDSDCILQALNSEQRNPVEQLQLFRHMRKFIRSLRFRHFSYDQKQSCLAAINEILTHM